MSFAEGVMSTSKGTHYSEHAGNKVEVLLFGTQMTYVLGSEGKATVGMETGFNIGTKSEVRMATNTTLEFGAQVQWFRGWNVEIAKEGGGTYEKAFAIKAGSVNPTAFFTLNLYLGLAIAAQAIAVGTSLALIKTVWVPKPDSKGEITYAGNPGFFAAVGVTNLFLGVITTLTTLALPKIIEKKYSITPKAAMSLNNSGFAFIGTNSLPLPNQGSAGLALSPTNFNLSFGPTTRNFTQTDSEITGFDGDATVEIKGNVTGLTIEAPTIDLSSPLGQQTTARLNFLNTPNKQAELILSTAAGRGSVLLGDDLSVQVSSTAGTSSSKFLAQPKKATIASLNAGVNTGFLEIDGANVTLESVTAQAKVVLSAAEATLSFGGNDVKVNPMGVSIGGSALTILAPAPGIPDVAKITELATIQAKDVARHVAQEAALQLIAVKDQLNETIVEKIATVQRTIETKIDKISTKIGAL
jgi:hypothetical protein